MRRTITAVLLAAFAGLAALPAPAAADLVRFGIKAGGNMARPTGIDARDPAATLKSRVGFTGGLFLAVGISPVLSIQSELLYTMKGATYVALDGSGTDTICADYVEVPLLIKLTVPSRGVQPFLFGGPTVGFKLREKVVSDGVAVPLAEPLLKSDDYGAVVGAGLSFGPDFAADVRYSLGAQRVLAAFEGPLEPDFKNGVWSFTLGFSF